MQQQRREGCDGESSIKLDTASYPNFFWCFHVKTKAASCLIPSKVLNRPFFQLFVDDTFSEGVVCISVSEGSLAIVTKWFLHRDALVRK
jgi:hypothetical protein